jgi:hypothetical protein
MVNSQTAQWTLYKQAFLVKDVGEIAHRASQILGILVGLPEYTQRNREGSILILGHEWAAPCAVALGKISESRREKYYRSAVHKYLVLMQHKECTLASLMEDKRVFGGGVSFLSMSSSKVSFIKAAVTCSGLPRFWDGALVFVLAIDMEWISEDETRQIAESNANPYFEVLFKASR